MKKEVERLNFDPRKEVRYLKDFCREERKSQLKEEIESSLAELKLSKYSHDFLLIGGEIFDKKSKIRSRDLVKNCDFEKRNLDKVEKEFQSGEKLVVNVSPKNRELDYPDDMVDFWVKGEKENLTWLRFKVEMDERRLKDFESMNKNGYKLVDLIKMLNLAGEAEGVTMNLIEGVTRNLVSQFEFEFGEKIYLDAELMTRMYISIRLEVEKQSKEIEIETRNYMVSKSEVERYIHGELKIEKVAGGGCGGSSLSGEFGGQGIIIVVTAEGISFRKGSTEGLNYCSKCGCWYSGEKCPICK